MSKSIQGEFLADFKSELVSKKEGHLMQVLDLLENLKMDSKNQRLVRISSELSDILALEENYEKVKNAKDLDELLEIIEKIDINDTMLKIYPEEILKKTFPTLAKKAFL